MNKQTVVFTDLDATLLKDKTYSFKEVQPALMFIRSRNIPLIICSSKTKTEIEFFRKLMGNQDPFISENGGAIFIPKGFFSYTFRYDKELLGYYVIERGTPYEVLIGTLNALKKELKVKIKGFSDMSPKEISMLTGLPEILARLAKMRSYDEPFLLEGEAQAKVDSIRTAVERRGLRLVKGGAFYHIIGTKGKGTCVKILIDLLRPRYETLQTIALGDSQNDKEMLEVVDIPILVKRPDGTYEKDVGVHNLTYANGIGPKGWNSAVQSILKS